ncbi:hypothetical protein M8C21_018020, partial [Ambrosia artemisiifolia]
PPVIYPFIYKKYVILCLCVYISLTHHTYRYTTSIHTPHYLHLDTPDKKKIILLLLLFTHTQLQPYYYQRERIMSQSQSDDSSSNEIMLFGVRVKVDPMRKSVSMNNLSQYQHLPNPLQSSNINNNINNNNNLDLSAVAADGYASADDVVVRTQSNGSRERKRGIPWTEDEHKLFLLGLQKVGKGDWRGISRNFVKTRTPTQVASHAQKYFLRRCNLNRRRRRSSLFDITTDSVSLQNIQINSQSQTIQL